MGWLKKRDFGVTLNYPWGPLGHCLFGDNLVTMGVHIKPWGAI